MAIAQAQPDALPIPPWRAAGLHFYSYNFHLRARYGERVQKVSVDAGFTCPNVDGTVTTGGCVFCDNRSFSPSRRKPRIKNITEQIDDGIRRLKTRYKVEKFFAYFQPATNTYAPVDRLRAHYEEALAHPLVSGLAIGTRPDCVPDDVLELIEELADRTHVSVEYGMQTMHDRSLDWMNRGHRHAATIEAIERSRGRGFEICLHIMLGLPGESHADMLATAHEVARLAPDAVKLHNLYAVHGTPMADDVLSGKIRLMELGDYVSTLVDFLELLPPDCIVERISGEAPPDFFIGPQWSLDKPGVRAAVAEEFSRRGTWQGRKFVASQ